MQEIILKDILSIFAFNITKFMSGVWLQRQTNKKTNQKKRQLHFYLIKNYLYLNVNVNGFVATNLVQEKGDFFS